MYRDLDATMTAHPDTGDLLVKTGTAAITQSIINLVLTVQYDRPFQPLIYGMIRGLLFENIDAQVADTLQSTVEQLINNYEPRALSPSVEAVADELNDGYILNITYRPAGSDKRVGFVVPLKRATTQQ